MIERLENLGHRKKLVIIMNYDFFAITASFYLSLVLRLGTLSPPFFQNERIFFLFSFVCLAQFLIFYWGGLYKGVWRYSSSPDLIRIIRTTAVAVVVAFIGLFILNRLDGVPRTSFVIDALLLITFSGGGRFLYKILREKTIEHKYRKNFKNVLVVGTCSESEYLAREISRNPSLNYRVIGYITRDRNYLHKTLHNKPVLGLIENIPTIVAWKDVHEVVIASSNTYSNEIKQILHLCKDINVQVKILPSMSDLINGKIHISQLRKINIVDLLGREEIGINTPLIENMLRNKTVLVSGAGGSIGSELCHQISKFSIKKLIAIDSSEYNLYQLEKKISESHPELLFFPIIADVRNMKALQHVFYRYRPNVVLHAAAYKHVPIMEKLPYEAIQTNILGTENIARCSIDYEIEKFVLISTDKAVNPTNIMGTTKRIAELLIQVLQKNTTHTNFMTVRFGNVLGSSGSVVPRFKEQIETGGPITITHPEITRYFMSIPEASKLVLEAAAIGGGGQLFILEMGDPIKILDLAIEMISLAGLKPYEDIDIQITGLRPGEKLYEELLLCVEETIPTSHKKIKVAKASPAKNNFLKIKDEILSLGPETDRLIFIDKLLEMVPEYSPYTQASSEPTPTDTEDYKTIAEEDNPTRIIH